MEWTRDCKTGRTDVGRGKHCMFIRQEGSQSKPDVVILSNTELQWFVSLVIQHLTDESMEGEESR